MSVRRSHGRTLPCAKIQIRNAQLTITQRSIQKSILFPSFVCVVKLTNMATATLPVILPATGKARVKSVLSGDTVVLLGNTKAQNIVPPEVIFTFESLNAPRYVFLLLS